jgi:hypothetical protein
MVYVVEGCSGRCFSGALLVVIIFVLAAMSPSYQISLSQALCPFALISFHRLPRDLIVH